MKKIVIAAFITVSLGFILVTSTLSPEADRHQTFNKGGESIAVASRGAGS
ncbi:hypothetical protein [Bacillus atrophaeus]|uniref:Uncharacterized protein n=1 Tax=Bacillus atrophaeus (strain 1942) TaxID=720555 RepID=A0ABM5LYB7_BACA1|nr:hypothetical protein [Bacillus atrophaeus]ADP32920.1 hypothetical protein BATR1942_09935 [Bacillus atrophaeus 1942]AIK49279.1 hypothetical protein DJ95_1873 [Bacillus atrophaeus subsp. globigii]EIM12293.1 hypothetical protein UY9_03416 [Bacillus atrophaeus C89]KFK81811.1 hypothetical protein DK44_1760 [Bacillus atrophaeus]MDS9997162.1 hypothetical protein [Bacillus atrophaeus]